MHAALGRSTYCHIAGVNRSDVRAGPTLLSRGQSLTLRFQVAEDYRRPHGSHQFYVWSPKLDRRLTLFGEATLNAWIAIEADAQILAFCERPLVIRTQKPARVVDFWIQRTTSEELWLLNRPAKRAKERDSVSPSFRTWAERHGLTVRQREAEEFAVDEQRRRNWATLLHYLAANGALLKQELLDGIRQACSVAVTLESLEQHFATVDPVLVRTGALSLFQKRLLESSDFIDAPIGPTMRFEAILSTRPVCSSG
jgi:hypothetical protein